MKKEMKQSDKQITIKFFIILAVSLIVGFVAGGASALLKYTYDRTNLSRTLLTAAAQCMPFLSILCNIAAAAAAFAVYSKCRKRADGWNGEDEDVINAIEDRLNIPLGLSSVMLILNLFFFGANVVGRDYLGENALPVWHSFGLILIILALGYVWETVLQIKVIDLEKKLNPEKQGNVLDMKFLKVWTQSCDEAEKLTIYHAGDDAYRMSSTVCLGLWVVTLIGAMLFDTGLFAMICVLLVWLCSTIRYLISAMNYNKKGNNE